MPETPPPDEPPPTIPEGWISALIFGLFLLVCLLSWWLIHRAAIPGAPGAPIG